MADLGLSGKRAVVSGAGYLPARAGHGRASALKLAAEGAIVACIDIDEGRARGIVAEITEAGGQAFPVVADMTDRAQVKRALDEAIDHMGGIDVCVDIIGGARWDTVEDFTDDDWAWTIQNNLTQVFYLFQEVGRRMIPQGTGGSIVAIASVDGIAAAGYHVAYGAAKAGVISLAKTFADELGRTASGSTPWRPATSGRATRISRKASTAMNNVNPLLAPRTRDIANACCSSPRTWPPGSPGRP